MSAPGLAAHLSPAELGQRYRAARSPIERSHLQIVWLLSQGRDEREVAQVTGYGRRWVGEVVRRYNEGGPDGLGDRRRGNGAKPTILTPAVLDKLRERLKSPPEDGGVWTAKKVAAVMAAELGLERVAEQRGWEALRAIGWTIQRPRPRHVRAASADEQAAFQKSLPKP